MGRLLLVVTIIVAAVFTAFPDVDLWMSAQFFRPGDGFYLKEAWWAVALYDAVPIIAVAVSLVCIALLLHNRYRGRRAGHPSNRFLVFVLAALAVGPGLVVNVGFKDHWGRARPRDVTEFAGTKRFTPALQPADQCGRNCSFVAGHPSVLFWLGALGYAVARGRRRNEIFAIAAMLGLLGGFGRVVQGGHFLSDVLFSGIVVFTVVWLLATHVFRVDASPRTPAKPA